jgi:integrase
MISEGMTMRTAAQAWLSHLQTRRRRPVKPSSAKTFESYISQWIVPHLGNLEVRGVGVAVLRDFIRQLDEAGLSPKSQNEIAGAAKAIIANCTNDEGEPLYPRHWDNERLDLPIVSHSEQHTPIVTRAQIEQAFANSDDSYQCLFALASGAGLRVGELLAVKLFEDGVSSVFDSSAATIRVRRSVWRGKEQSPKTSASVRDVEIPFELSEFIARFAGNREGYLFGNGKCMDVTTARKRLDKAIGKGIGFHSFRRFFVSHRRANGMPEDILKRLVGHSSAGDITSRYNSYGAQSSERREWVEKVGLGFELPR